MTQLVRTQTEAAAPIWIQYLIGAWPQTKVTAVTLGIMESQFADTDADSMLEAVKAYVAENKYWPAVSELRKYVDRVQLDRQHRGPFYLWHKEYAADHWTLCPGPCGELTPSLDNCPFCEDMKVTL